MSQKPEIIEYAKSKGAKGIQLGGICCTANEIFQRHGVPQAGTFLQQELAIVTGACDAMVVDIQCVFQNLANVAKCFHTKLITTHPIAKMEQDNVLHIEFDEHHALEDAERLKMILQNIEQYLVQDDENQTAYLNLPNSSYWWYWYGSEYEAHAYYLKLLARTDPKGTVAPRLVKYLLNNRKHATYWYSTRDTALCLEAIAGFIGITKVWIEIRW